MRATTASARPNIKRKQEDTMKMRNSTLCLLIALALLLGTALPGLAQSTSATLSGTVTDQTGAVLPEVKISVVNLAKRSSRHTTTNKEGAFTVPQLDPGTYSLRAERSGFATTQVSDIVLNTNDRQSLQIKLQVGKKEDTITVEAGTIGKVDLDASVKTVVDQRFIANMPLQDRSLTALLTVIPGVVEFGGYAVNGIRTNNNYFSIDGVAANTGIGVSAFGLGGAGVGQYLNTTTNGLTQSLISADSLEEFKVQSSGVSAEFGRSSGGQIQMTTRSGSNAFHGTAFDYFRNEVFDAFDPSDKFYAAQSKTPVVKPPRRQNQFGGTFSGPVIIPGLYNGKDKTFFFANYEGLRLLTPTNGRWLVPPAEERTNSSLYYPGLQPYLTMLPLPNAVDPDRGYPVFVASYANTSSHDSTSVRIDQVVNSKLTLFGRYAHTPSDSKGRGNIPNIISQSLTKSDMATLGATLLISNSLSNEVRANWTQSSATTRNTMDTFGGGKVPTEAMLKQMFPAAYGATPENAYFFMLMGQSATRGPNGEAITPWFVQYYGTQATNKQRQINLVDNLSWIHGKHNFKFGADWRFLYPSSVPFPSFLWLQLVSSSYASPAALAGNSLYNGTAPGSAVLSMDSFVFHVHNISLYAQDTFRVTPRLTLDYGVRWDYNPALYSVSGGDLYTLKPFDLNNPGAARLASGPAYTAKKDAFAPRVGVSYQLRSNPGWETVLRGSYGLFYDSATAAMMDLTSAYPHQHAGLWPSDKAWMEVTPPAILRPDPMTAEIPYGGDLYAFYNFTYPVTHQWNFAVQQGFGGKHSLTASYVGSAGRDLIRRANLDWQPREPYIFIRPRTVPTITPCS
jgi:hypothetical protein